MFENGLVSPFMGGLRWNCPNALMGLLRHNTIFGSRDNSYEEGLDFLRCVQDATSKGYLDSDMVEYIPVMELCTLIREKHPTLYQVGYIRIFNCDDFSIYTKLFPVNGEYYVKNRMGFYLNLSEITNLCMSKGLEFVKHSKLAWL